MSKPFPPDDDPDVPPLPLGLEPDPIFPSDDAPLPSAPPLPGPALAAAAPPADVITIAGGAYRLLRRLGTGGQGEVFLARRLGAEGFERDVALKWLLPSAQADIRSFVDEARIAATLHHPAIAQVYDLAPYEGRGFVMVLEYVQGKPLRAIIEAARKKRVALTEAFACFVAAELAGALDYAHRAVDSAGQGLGIVHRDVTPHNVMLSEAGAVKLLDFGIAFSRLENREVTSSKVIKGKDEYYAPEALLGLPLDGRADQFALALCVYEMLALKRLFKFAQMESDTQLHLRISQATPETIGTALASARIDDSLKQILHHALAPAREERFATCAAFGDALRVFSQHRGWLYGPADAARELEQLFALPDSVDPEKTNNSGPRRYSAQPRVVPRSTVQLPPLTPGRTAGPQPPPLPGAAPSVASRELDDSDVPPPPIQLPSAAAAAEPPLRLEQLELEHAHQSPPPPEAAIQPPPSNTAIRRREQLQVALENPQADARRSLILPAAILAATLVIGVVVVKVFLTATKREPAAIEVVKTPEQLRAEKEAKARAIETVDPRLAPPPSGPATAGLADTPVAGGGGPPSSVSRAGAGASPLPGGRPHVRSPDAKSVDDALQKRYGGRPVVTPDAPQGTIASPAATGPRHRSLDSPMMTELGPSIAHEASLSLTKGTIIAAKLVAPADSSQPAPVTATVVDDVRGETGAIVIPKGATLFCTTTPGASRLGLHCDSVAAAGHTLTLQTVAFGVDHRVGLPIPRMGDAAPTGPGAGDVLKDSALNTARTVLGRVTPEGVAGDLTQGATDGTTGALRGAGSRPTAAPAGQAPLVPAGTRFTLFVDSPR